jgi:hypothetical protein
MNPSERVWCRNRNAIVDELRERGLNEGVFVEIGVKQGVFSKVLLENTNCRKLILIDPWEDQDVKDYDEIQHNHQNDYEVTMNKLRDFIDAGRVEVLRGLSSEVAHRIPPGSVDFIYVDGNHS